MPTQSYNIIVQCSMRYSYDVLVLQKGAYICMHVQVEARTLSHQLEEVKGELSVEKSRCRFLEGTCGVAGDENVDIGKADKKPREVGSDQVATLEMNALNATQRAELASAR